ncbi:isochorismate synthase [Corynebacterium aquilae]|uniref:isochorismate synthase n=1 Tax=Corynebacterium aquilae DSM 44791 TaxID=1431546 RepID=A0A1L7CFL8_9CORY|nr:isochorismate synthase [Corynebacterium aquilae]APT84628.1 isochorismate synthase [Corynebacterium aquilae DSM 44791]
MFASRPASAPDFLLSRPHGSVRTQGSMETFTDPEDAITALRDNRVEMVVGALPFAIGGDVALTVPEKIIREDGPLEPHAYYRLGPGAQLHARLTGVEPSREEHIARVQAAINTIERTCLEKVVLARRVDIGFDEPTDPLLVAARLIDGSPTNNGFIADLSPAGGGTLVGSSPEVLIKKQGSTISAYPLAGSVPRGGDKVEDELRGRSLLESSKDALEHQFVVDALRGHLEPLCSQLSIPSRPELMRTREMWHLATPITGQLKDSGVSALELALVVHPTPAICGTPTEAAAALIETAEDPRGFYAGAVGWSDASGDGEFMVAIRCAEVAADCLSARAWAGGGIVADSVPVDEFDETTAKLGTLLRALGISASAG